MNEDFSQYEQAAEWLKALAHPVRLCIVRGLLEKGSCNVGYMQQCLELPQSTVSQHLQKLRSAGIIRPDRKGLEMIYRITNPLIADLIATLFKEASVHE